MTKEDFKLICVQHQEMLRMLKDIQKHVDLADMGMNFLIDMGQLIEVSSEQSKTIEGILND